jgi:hypothetical protein
VPAAARAGGLARHEAAIKDLLANVDKITTLLAMIKDAESSKEATPALKQAAKEWEAIRKKASDLPPPAQDEKTQLEKKYKEPLEMAQKRLFAEVGRVRMTSGGLDALAAIAQVLGQKTKDKKDGKDKKD